MAVKERILSRRRERTVSSGRRTRLWRLRALQATETGSALSWKRNVLHGAEACMGDGRTQCAYSKFLSLFIWIRSIFC